MCIKTKTHRYYENTLQYEYTYALYIHKLNILKLLMVNLKNYDRDLVQNDFFSVTGGSTSELFTLPHQQAFGCS
jgi:hypothetical protein